MPSRPWDSREAWISVMPSCRATCVGDCDAGLALARILAGTVAGRDRRGRRAVAGAAANGDDKCATALRQAAALWRVFHAGTGRRAAVRALARAAGGRLRTGV